MSTTRVERHIAAPRAKVYRALIDAEAIQNVPDAVQPSDNELGWKLSLDKLARLVE